MTSIEVFLLIFSLILILILFNYSAAGDFANKKIKIGTIITFFSKTYRVFQKIRQLSLIYLFKNKFYKVYLLLAITVVVVKLNLHYNSQLNDALPSWTHKAINFLIVSSVWELICIITKLVENKISKK